MSRRAQIGQLVGRWRGPTSPGISLLAGVAAVMAVDSAVRQVYVFQLVGRERLASAVRAPAARARSIVSVLIVRIRHRGRRRRTGEERTSRHPVRPILVIML